MTENWKAVPGYKGYYEVSDVGNVRSIDRIVYRSDGGSRFQKGRILNKTPNTTGYLSVTFCTDKRKTFPVHKLVAMAFLGHSPQGYKELVDHIDNNCLNNKLTNLQLTDVRTNVTKDLNRGSSSLCGVYWNNQKQKWQSCITVDGKKKHIGYFNTDTDGHLAYKQAVKQLQCS